ncbi:MAG: PD40 domain-containing protein [Deltaproteobacteria bacterium]|nr:PD40 domain-containing protein [Deltaproteobacteria bacterium]
MASNLVPKDKNDVSDVFVYDWDTRKTERVSLGPKDAEANDSSTAPSISSDGRYVAFQSVATNLVPGAPRLWQIFVRDRTDGDTERVSVNDEGKPANNDCESPSISGDGRWVAFVCNAWNLATGVRGTAKQVYLHDRKSHRTTLVSKGAGAQAGNWMSWQPKAAGDGVVAFETYATNLVPSDKNDTSDVVVAPPGNAPLEAVSVDGDGALGNGPSLAPSLSAHGRYVVFSSSATNLVSDSNQKVDVFLRDRKTGDTECVSEAPDGSAANGDSWFPVISADGLVRAYESDANDLVPGDTNQMTDIFVQQVEPAF